MSMAHKILLVTDAWQPQVNGVVRTLNATVEKLIEWGFDVKVIHPDMFVSVPLPFYPEIRVPIFPCNLEEMIDEFSPDFIHIATEGRLGWLVRKICIKRNWKFTTAYHTDFPGYLKTHFGISQNVTYNILRKFHNAGSGVMVATRTISHMLANNGFSKITPWGRGIDTALFYPRARTRNSKPLVLYVGRISKEKNIEAFYELGIDAKLVAVGSGPQLEKYRTIYPHVEFVGKLSGDDLVKAYSDADVMVFPSKTDTFGLVIIESLACGTPVAAYPVQGPIDILTQETGCMDRDLNIAVKKALKLKRKNAADHGRTYTWDSATMQFVRGLVPR